MQIEVVADQLDLATAAGGQGVSQDNLVVSADDIQFAAIGHRQRAGTDAKSAGAPGAAAAQCDGSIATQAAASRDEKPGAGGQGAGAADTDCGVGDTKSGSGKAAQVVQGKTAAGEDHGAGPGGGGHGAGAAAADIQANDAGGGRPLAVAVADGDADGTGPRSRAFQDGAGVGEEEGPAI